jgi:hypothetical protein
MFDEAHFVLVFHYRDCGRSSFLLDSGVIPLANVEMLIVILEIK